MTAPYSTRALALISLTFCGLSLGSTENHSEILQRMTDETLQSRSAADAIESARSRLQELVARQPDNRVSASVYINNGAVEAEVEEMVESNALEITGLQMKAPSSDRSNILTLGLSPSPELLPCGQLDSVGLDVPLAFNFALSQMATYNNLSGDLEAESATYDGSLLRVFRLDVIGTSRALSSLSKRQNVVAVYPDTGRTKIDEYQFSLRMFSSLCQ